MNWLFVAPEEISSENRVVFRGERRDYVRKWHDLSEGQSVPGIIGGKSRATFLVSSISREEIVLEVVETLAELPARLPVHLCVAVSRPQTVKKVLQLSSMFGILSLEFFPSYKAPKSYLQSSALEQKVLLRELRKGQEQVGDPIAPLVSVYQTQEAFFAESLAIRNCEPESRFIAAPAAENEDVSFATQMPCALAIGPEIGWGDQERERFSASGFRTYSLGERALRVEVAASALLGSLSHAIN